MSIGRIGSVSTEILVHENDTTNVHGIANTSQVALTTGKLSQFAATTSAELAGVISNETGSGNLVFGTNPTLSQPSIDNPRFGYTTTATSAGTLTLTATSTHLQYFTGTTTHTLVLPVTSTLALGQTYVVRNDSTGAVTVQSSGLNTIATIPGGMSARITCILTSGTTAASWSAEFTGSNTVTGTGSNVYSISPAFTGTPTAPTAAGGTNTTQVATTAFVNAEIANDAVLNSLIQDKSKIAVGNGSSVVALAAGADGTVLTADSTTATGLKYAAVGGGKDDADNIIATQVFG